MPENKNQVPDNLPEFIAYLKSEGVKPEQFMSRIDRFLDFKARDKGVPLHGKFELTPLCNLDCKMCYVHLNKAQMQSSTLIPVSVWKELAKAAVDIGMSQIELTGGECLTYPDFDELYLYLHSYGIKINVFTNGILLDEKRIEFFKAHPPCFIQVSLYGADEDTYEAVTGHRMFNRVADNIRNAISNGLPLQIAITPNRFITGKGEEIVKTALSFGAPIKINFALLDPRENTDRHGEKLEAPLDEYVKMLHAHAKARGLDVSAVDSMSLPDIGSKNGKSEFGMRCGAGRSGFSIDWQGAMHPCNSLFDIKAFPLEVGFSAAWSEINKISNSYPRPVECSECSYRDICLPCIALHSQGAEKGHANPMICERTRRMAQEGLLKLNGM